MDIQRVASVASSTATEPDKNPVANVSMGECKQVGAREGIKTSGMSSCMALAIISPESKLLMHVSGASLAAPMRFNNRTTTAGALLTQLASQYRLTPRTDIHLCVVFGSSDENRVFAQENVLTQTWKDQTPLQDLLNQFPHSNVHFFCDHRVEIGKNGEMEASIKDNHPLLVLSETDRNYLLEMLALPGR